MHGLNQKLVYQLLVLEQNSPIWKKQYVKTQMSLLWSMKIILEEGEIGLTQRQKSKEQKERKT